MQTHVTYSATEIQSIPLATSEEGTLQFRFQAEPGLYQFSVIIDASAFDWSELYFPLHQFGNTGQITGPWDFNLLDKNKPLVPSYWFSVDDHEIGLWFTQRVSLEDIQARRFRGRAAFRVHTAGEVELRFKPYRPMAIHWMSATLERDPEDSFLEQLPSKLSNAHFEAEHWSTPAFWEEQRARLATSHQAYREPMERVFRWLNDKCPLTARDLPLLIAAAELQNDEIARDRVLETLDAIVSTPHWGNPNPEGYSHNGDMGAAFSLKWLAWSLHALGDQLDEERRGALLAKLRLQGERFLDLTLLNRDYWGGSVLQDHGRLSLSAFGCAALYLLDVLPEATTWLKYAIPRVQRSIEAMPRDGTLPPSSYCNLSAYMDDMTDFRDALLAYSGQDLFDEAPFRPIVDYLLKVVHPKSHSMITVGNQGDCMPFVGGNTTLNRFAQKYSDARAAHLHHVLVQRPESVFLHPAADLHYHYGTFWGFFSFDPAIESAAPEAPALQLFADSGFVHYQDPQQDLTLSARCGPWLGHHAYRHAQGPCDRMGQAPTAGHFIVGVEGKPLLGTPDAGYSLRSCLGTCLLIDGRGQFGDVGYPMSIPSWLHRGEEIESARWDETTQQGTIRFNLQPAYPEEMGVISYVRELLLCAGGTIICRDRVLLREPQPLSWLFQAASQVDITLEGEASARFGQGPSLKLAANPLDFELCASVADTAIVWSYSSANNFQPFRHLRWDSTAKLGRAAVDFVLSPL